MEGPDVIYNVRNCGGRARLGSTLLRRDMERIDMESIELFRAGRSRRGVASTSSAYVMRARAGMVGASLIGTMEMSSSFAPMLLRVIACEGIWIIDRDPRQAQRQDNRSTGSKGGIQRKGTVQRLELESNLSDNRDHEPRLGCGLSWNHLRLRLVVRTITVAATGWIRAQRSRERIPGFVTKHVRDLMTCTIAALHWACNDVLGTSRDLEWIDWHIRCQL